MANNYTIGLNETKLGIVAPFWFMSSMKNTISNRESELALTSARLYKTDEAFKVGLIDEIAETREDVLSRAENFFKRFDGIHPVARALTKQQLRGKLVEVGAIFISKKNKNPNIVRVGIIFFIKIRVN